MGHYIIDSQFSISILRAFLNQRMSVMVDGIAQADRHLQSHKIHRVEENVKLGPIVLVDQNHPFHVQLVNLKLTL